MDGTSQIFCRDLQPVFIDRLQKYRFCLFKALPDRPVSGLSEIPALCVL